MGSLDGSLDYALMVTTICFVDDIMKSIREAHRVLKRSGSLIIGFGDKNSPIGQQYQKHKYESVFYRDAVFYSTEEVTHVLQINGFVIESTWQTVFWEIEKIKAVQKVLPGQGRGSFIVIHAKKNKVAKKAEASQ